jgi:hypothetical protein
MDSSHLHSAGKTRHVDTKRRRLSRLASGALAAVLLGVSMQSAASASTSKAPNRVTFGVEPAGTTGADGRPNFSFSVTPGGSLDDHVAILNFSSVVLSLQVYAVDAVETATGGLGLTLPGSKQTGVGDWVDLPARFLTVRVPAETNHLPGQVVLPLLVKVPLSATPGDHVGGIVASLRTVGVNSSGQHVILNQRIGTRVYVDVAGKAVPRLSIQDLAAAYDGTLDPIGRGRVRVSYLVTNTGNVDYGVTQRLSLSGLFGSTTHASMAPIALLIPGASVRESVVLKGVFPEFIEHLSVTADAVAPPNGTSPRLGPVVARDTVWAIPWPLIVLLFLLLSAIYAWRRWRNRRRGAEPVAVVENELVAA